MSPSPSPAAARRRSASQALAGSAARAASPPPRYIIGHIPGRAVAKRKKRREKKTKAAAQPISTGRGQINDAKKMGFKSNLNKNGERSIILVMTSTRAPCSSHENVRGFSVMALLVERSGWLTWAPCPVLSLSVVLKAASPSAAHQGPGVDILKGVTVDTVSSGLILKHFFCQSPSRARCSPTCPQ